MKVRYKGTVKVNHRKKKISDPAQIYVYKLIKPGSHNGKSYVRKQCASTTLYWLNVAGSNFET